MGGVGGAAAEAGRAAGALNDPGIWAPVARMALSAEQIDRYSRQILVPEIGGRGQERLLAATVACLGDCESLRVAASYLAAAGVTVAQDPTSAERDADVLLIGAAPGAQRAEPCAAPRPAFVVGEDAGTAWYSRHTNDSDCPRCSAAAAEACAGEAGENAPVPSAASVAGAALALDVVARLTGIDAAGSPELVLFRRGGTERQTLPLASDACRHRRAGEA